MHSDKTIIRNAKIWTGFEQPQVSSIGILGNRVTAVGSDADLADFADASTKIIDAQGKRIIPGLIDSHIHMIRAGLTWNQHLDWSGIKSLAQGMEMISEMASEKPAGTWICVVGGWGPGQFSEGRGPTAEELTNLAPNHPVFVQYLYESAVLNESALSAAGVTSESKDPDRGTFERDSQGQPTGVCRGVGAFALCLGLAGRPDFDTQVEWTAAMMRRLNRLGLVGVIDPGGMGMSPEAYRPIYELWRRQEMTIRTRIYMMVQGAGNERVQMREFMKYLHPGFGDDWLKLTGAGEIVSYGFMDLEGVNPFTVTQEGSELLEELLVELIEAGWSVHLHAVLRETITAMLDAIERAVKKAPADNVRISLAHAEPITNADLDRVKNLGMGIAIQDRMVFRAKDSADFWGEEILRRSPPLREMLNRGIPVGGGTDATAVSPYDPWRSLWWLVTGKTLDPGPERDADQNLTREEALAAYTSGSAWFSHDEAIRGTLQPGMLADLAILSADYFEVNEEEIPNITAEATMVDGKFVYVSDSFSTTLT
ncbi:amidohydrolase [Candidatus Nanopelagicales bacterium]|nr:amidohydrolase [Actinomycetota bacterium]MDC1474233.1 amidohydrolase [Candidatus Nanopelagicales bacterium]